MPNSVCEFIFYIGHLFWPLRVNFKQICEKFGIREGIFEKWKVKRPSGRVCVDALRGKWDWEPPTCCDCPAAAPTHTPTTAPTHTSSWWEKLGWHLMAPFLCGFCIFTCLRWKPDGSEKWILAVKIYHSHTTKLERTSTIKICEEKKSDEISSFYGRQTYLQMLPKSSNALFSPAFNQVTLLPPHSSFKLRIYIQHSRGSFARTDFLAKQN